MLEKLHEYISFSDGVSQCYVSSLHKACNAKSSKESAEPPIYTGICKKWKGTAEKGVSCYWLGIENVLSFVCLTESILVAITIYFSLTTCWLDCHRTRFQIAFALVAIGKDVGVCPTVPSIIMWWPHFGTLQEIATTMLRFFAKGMILFPFRVTMSIADSLSIFKSLIMRPTSMISFHNDCRMDNYVNYHLVGNHDYCDWHDCVCGCNVKCKKVSIWLLSVNPASNDFSVCIGTVQFVAFIIRLKIVPINAIPRIHQR